MAHKKSAAAFSADIYKRVTLYQDFLKGTGVLEEIQTKKSKLKKAKIKSGKSR